MESSEAGTFAIVAPILEAVTQLEAALQD